MFSFFLFFLFKHFFSQPIINSQKTNNQFTFPSEYFQEILSSVTGRR